MGTETEALNNPWKSMKVCPKCHGECLVLPPGETVYICCSKCMGLGRVKPEGAP